MIILVVAALGALAAAGVLVVWIMGGMSPRSPGPRDEGGDGVVLAQEPSCRFFEVAADALNVFKEPRGASEFIGMLGRSDVVCVARDQQVGDLVWAYIVSKLEREGQRKAMEGWAIKRSLKSANPAGLAVLLHPPDGAPPPPPPPVEARPPASDIVRFSDPISVGASPVSGHSLEELIAGIPTFPPIEGLDESAWKKTCNNCHKWDRQTLCAQGTVYAKNPSAVLRIPHPYGGEEKTAMMKWAETGCQ